MSVEQENTPQSTPDDDLPDWLKEIRGESKTSSADVPAKKSVEESEALSESEEISADDALPDWLKDTQVEEQSSTVVEELSADPSPDQEQAETPADVADEDTSTVEEAAAEDDEADDWKRLLAEEGIQMDNLDEDRPDGSEDMSLRDWLAATSSESPLADSKSSAFADNDVASDEGQAEQEEPIVPESAEQKPESDDNEPAWLSAEETSESDMPSWLAEESTSEPETPSWLSDEADIGSEVVDSAEETVAENVADDEDLPEWLREDASSADDSPVPSWLEDEETIDETPLAAEALETSSDVASEDDGIIVEDELPDWLREDSDGGSDVEAPAWLVDEDINSEVAETLDASIIEEADSSIESEFPESDKVVDAKPIETVAKDDGIVVEDELPDWLRQDSSMDNEIETPAWLSEDDTSDVSSIDSLPSVLGDDDGIVLEDELPDWLSEGEDTTAEETSDVVSDLTSAQDSSDIAADDLPDWLQGSEPADDIMIASETATEGERSDAIPGLDDDQIVDTDGLPDWLREEEGALSASAAVAEDGEPPDWLTDVSEDSTSTTADPAIEDVPDWLQEDVKPQDEPVTESVDGAIDAESETKPDHIIAETPAPTKPSSGADQHILDKLSVARGTLESGELNEALTVYQDLIAEQQGLDQIIAVLNENLARFVEQPAIYEALGDAYMRQGNLSQSLEAYQRALSHL